MLQDPMGEQCCKVAVLVAIHSVMLIESISHRFECHRDSSSNLSDSQTYTPHGEHRIRDHHALLGNQRFFHQHRLQPCGTIDYMHIL